MIDLGHGLKYPFDLALLPTVNEPTAVSAYG